MLIKKDVEGRYRGACSTYLSKNISMPSPSKDEMSSDEFSAIWDIIKTWDINVPEYYNGYSGGNGSHVKLILDSLIPVLRNNKINNILK